MIVRVVPDVPAVSRRRFDYSVPERWWDGLTVGSRVRVPFHGRRVGGWVAELGSEPPPGVEVRDVTGLSGHGPPASVMALAEWAAWRWAMPVSSLLRTASPDRVVSRLPEPPVARLAGSRGGQPPPGTTLRREPPARDLLPLVLDAVAGSRGQVLVLAPSVGWAGRLAERLRRRGVDVAADWAQAAAGWPVVVGSRRAAWSPVRRLDAVVVLDAHDQRDRYDATLVAAERAARDGAPCLLVSPCPTASLVAGFGPTVTPGRDVERSGWPVVLVADRRGADPRSGLLSEELVGLARRVLPGRLVCVLNRTGRAKLLACAACGELARCANCGRPVELGPDALTCPGCRATRPVVCAACGATRLKVLRQGVSRVREELEALLGVGVGEVTATGPEVPPTPVLVGTTAVLHRVRRAAAVAFLDFDQHLLAPRFGAGEEALALLGRAARLTGGRPAGVVLVQTRLPDHEVVRAAALGDPGLFTELELRRELRLPPFAALATVRGPERPDLGDVEVSPLRDGRWLVRAPDHRVLCDALAPLGGGVRVDPTDV